MNPIKFLFLLVFFLSGFFFSNGQACSTIGQTPATAFPVCGLDTFAQSTVPICVNKPLDVPGCPAFSGSYSDKNPFWYKFTCYKSGTLGFRITPKDLGDDYDWQIFDVTGHDPGDVYADPSLFVVGNWSGSYGVTGATSAGTDRIECASDPSQAYENTFSIMPTLIQGHNYLLLISHFTNTQSGYSLVFGYGGTASITDPATPGVAGASPTCDRTQIRVRLTKQLKCSSVAADGSDFSLSPSSSSIVSAVGNGCSSGFDMDTVTVTLSNPLPYDQYNLTVKIGTDGNTLLDNCNSGVPVGSSVSFAIVPGQPTPFDSITQPGCAPDLLQLVFSKPIHCNSINPAGTDFVVTGPTAVSVTGASGVNCDADGLSSIVRVRLSAPIVSKGLYHIQLVSGIDGNTIVDECGIETPAGAILDFTTSDTVSASFNDQIDYGCKIDTILFGKASDNGIDHWEWTFDGTLTSSLQNPVEYYSVFGSKEVQLIVSNGVCSDTLKTSVLLNNTLKSDFEAPNTLCPKDFATFKNNSIGRIVNWDWDFGDGVTSQQQTPPDQLYPIPGLEKDYSVRLIVRDDLGCADTSYEPVKTLKSCYIAVPTAFTPNGDGLNDYLYPLNAYKADHLEFRVFNRYGQLVFESGDWTQKWDGRINGILQSPGTYVWSLQYTDRDSGRKFFQKGTSILIR